MEAINFNRKQLADYIMNTAKDSFIEKVKAMLMNENNSEQNRLDKMIEEGEEDIKAGRVHSMNEVKSMIDNWKTT